MSFADILSVSKKGLTGRISSSFTTVKGRIPTNLSTGSLFLDYMWNGGFIWSASHQFYGPSGAGKSTAFYKAMGANQKVDLELQKVGMGSLPNFLPKRQYERLTYRPILICDAEGSTNELFLTGCGVDIDPAKMVEQVDKKTGEVIKVPTNPNEVGKFAIFEPEYGEDWFNYHKRVNLGWFKQFHDDKSNKMNPDYVPILSLIDSVATLVPKSLLEDEQQQIAFLARLLSNFLPVQMAVDMKARSTTFFVNQVRTNPIQKFGNPEVLRGGAAPFHAASGNFRISRTGDNEDIGDIFGDDIGGRNIVYTLKLSPKKCRWAAITGDVFEIRTIMGKGYSKMSDMWNYATATGQIKRNGAWYTLEVIGREDLNITKNVREADLKKHFVDNNLWEVFVLQLFTGAAWRTTALNQFQLEAIGAIRTDEAPDLDLALEQEIDASAQLQQKGFTDLAQTRGDIPDDSDLPSAPSSSPVPGFQPAQA